MSGFPISRNEITERNLMTRDVLRKAIRIALPSIVSSLLVWAMSALNFIFMAAFLPYTSIASYGVVSSYVAFAAGIFVPLSTAAGFILDRAISKGDSYHTRTVVTTSLIMAITIGVLSTLVAMLVADLYCNLIATPATILQESIAFLRSFSITFIPILYFNVTTFILLRFKEFAGPILAEISALMLHGGFSYIFVGLFSWGVRGIAISAFISQSVGALINTYLVFHALEKNGVASSPVFSWRVAKEFASEEHPALFTAVVAGVFGIFLQYFVNELGTVTIAAFALMFLFQDALFLPINALKAPARRLSEEYYEDKNSNNLFLAMMPMVGLAVTYALILIPVVRFGGTYLFQILSKGHTGITSQGETLLTLMSSYYIFYAISTLLSASLEGLQKKQVAMVCNIVFVYGVRFAILIPSAIYVQGMESVAIAFPISWAALSIALSIFYFANFATLRQKHKYSI